jgi:hypothetical protein
MVFVRDTFGTPGVSVIMAMSMEKTFVAKFLSSTERLWCNVIDFNHISVL